MEIPEEISPTHGDGCCADVFQSKAASSSVAESQKAFDALIRSVQAAGALDEKQRS